MIRAVLVDVGGVLVRTEDLEPRRQWERRFGMRDWELADLVFNNPVSQRASLGQATWDDNWAEVARRLSLPPAELEALRADFWKGDVWDEGLIRYIASLRARVKTGIISNALRGAREQVTAQVGGANFDEMVFSYEEGVEKPDPEIYRRALARLGVQPAEAVFVDDMLPNVEGARAVGMFGILFTHPAQARTEIEQLLNSHA